MKNKINFKVFIPTLVLIAIILIVVSVNLNNVQNVVDAVYAFMSSKFGWLFILVNIAAFAFTLWLVFSKYGNIRLGGENAKPTYSKFSWIAMMFTTSCSAGLIVFGFIEPIIYASDPPFHLEGFTEQAYEYAQMYTHYHWGFTAWTLYVPISIAIGLVIYNKKRKRISVSEACEPILKKQSKGVIGVIVDVLGTLGAVVAPVTSMGLGMPLLTMLLQSIFNIPDRFIMVLQIIILVIWILIFGTSVFMGLKKGIKNLSNINVGLAFGFMLSIGLFFVGPVNMFKSEINTIGLYINNFVRMITYTDPYGDGQFVQSWTVWYWAWLIVYMPLMGVFNARISKGRKLKEVAIGQMIWCSLGCWVAMMTLGNYSIKVQQSGMVDIANIITNQGQPAAIVAILKTLPANKFMMVIVAILCFVFMATTVDSSSYVAAEITSNHESNEKEASRLSRIFWAVISCIITFVLLQIGGFNAVQVLAILIGLPLVFVMILVIISAIKTIKQEANSTKEEPAIPEEIPIEEEEREETE